MLLAEVERLADWVGDFSKGIERKLQGLEKDHARLDEDNARLRRNVTSTYFERDACVGLIARLAERAGFRVGTKPTEPLPRVVVDLPVGQVCWEYDPSEAHLFDWLPVYPGEIEEQSTQELYARVMNPHLETGQS